MCVYLFVCLLFAFVKQLQFEPPRQDLRNWTLSLHFSSLCWFVPSTERMKAVMFYRTTFLGQDECLKLCLHSQFVCFCDSFFSSSIFLSAASWHLEAEAGAPAIGKNMERIVSR